MWKHKRQSFFRFPTDKKMWSDYDFVNIKGVVDHMFWGSRGIELLATESLNLKYIKNETFSTLSLPFLITMDLKSWILHPDLRKMVH